MKEMSNYANGALRLSNTSSRIAVKQNLNTHLRNYLQVDENVALAGRAGVIEEVLKIISVHSDREVDLCMNGYQLLMEMIECNGKEFNQERVLFSFEIYRGQQSDSKKIRSRTGHTRVNDETY